MRTPTHPARSKGKFSAIALALMLLVGGAGGLVWLLPPAPPVLVATNNGSARLNARLAWYLHSGQWRADARTFAALVKYLVSPEPTPLSNQPTLPA